LVLTVISSPFNRATPTRGVRHSASDNGLTSAKEGRRSRRIGLGSSVEDAFDFRKALEEGGAALHPLTRAKAFLVPTSLATIAQKSAV
jgi:hypothetical protein